MVGRSEIQGGHPHTGSDPPTWWGGRAGPLPHPGPHLPRSLPPVAWGAGTHNGSQGGGGGHQMSPPPHSPRWRPGPHPGAGGRGTGLGPHHHHRGLHHPTHSQRKPGTWKGQRGCEGGVMGVGRGGAVPALPGSKSQQTPCWAIKEEGRTGREGTAKLRSSRSSRCQNQKDQGPQLPRDSLCSPSTAQTLPLRGAVRSTSASSRKASGFNRTRLWPTPSRLSTPSGTATYSREPARQRSPRLRSAS